MKLVKKMAAIILIGATCAWLTPVPAFAQGTTLPCKFIVAASPYLSQPDSISCYSNSCNFILSTMHPGEEICFYSGLELNPVSTLEIPTNLAHDNPVARARRLAGGLAATKGWLLTDRPHSAEWDAAVDVPGFLALAASQLRSSPHQPLTVIIIGSPFYVGPSGQLSAFAMSDGYIPSDGTLMAAQGRTPFAIGASDALDGIVVHWAYLHEGFAHEQNRFACGRFWTLYCESQSSRLATFSASPALAFDRAHMDIVQSCFKATFNDADSKVILMRKVVIEREPHPQQTNSVPSSTNHAAIGSTPELHNDATNSAKLDQSPATPRTETREASVSARDSVAIELASMASVLPMPASGKLGIGCVWISPGSKHPEQADLHLYVTTPDGQVIFDGNTDAQSGAGHYFRDVRSTALSVDTNGVSSKSWEFVELRGMNEGDIGKLRCAINVFHGSGNSIRGLFQVVHGQKKATQSFSFDTATGNSGADREERPSPFWQDFDIKGMLHDATTAHR